MPAESPSSHKPKVSRMRKSASCEPCRKRKLRCSRVLPCETCVSKHEEDQCVWSPHSVPPLATARERNETENLKSEVARLQALVNILSSRDASAHGSSMLSSISSGSSSETEPYSAPLLAKDTDLAALDLAQRLGQLTITQFLNGHESSGHNIRGDLLSEARRILDHGEEPSSPPDNFVYGAGPAPTITVFPFSPNRWSTTQEILALLPSRDLADAAAHHYWKEIDWYLHPCPRHIFQSHTDAVWLAVHSGADVEPFSLSVVLAIWGVGLAHMPATHRVRNQKIERKEETAKLWLEMASSCLTIGGFLERPDLEAVRALLCMCTHYMCLSAGDDAGAGVMMLITAVQCCLHLQLHRDPSKLGDHFSVEEAEDRRRVFWLLFWVEQCASAATGRRFTLLHLGDIDSAIPSPLPDSEMGLIGVAEPRESEMTSLVFRIRIAQHGEQVANEVYGIKPVSFSTVMAFDRQLDALEADVPAPYSKEAMFGPEPNKDPTRCLRAFMIHACLAQERLRLHRPYQTRSYYDETFRFSRDTCIAAAQQIITIHASPVLNQAVWASMNYKAVCASIVLAIDLLQVPNGPQAEQHRQDIRGTLERIRKISNVSKLCHRATKVLQFLLQRDGEVEKAERLPKRNRQNTGAARRVGTFDAESTEEDLPRRTSLTLATYLEPTPDIPVSAPTDSWDVFDDILGFNPSYPAFDGGMPYADAAVSPLFSFNHPFETPLATTSTGFPISFDFSTTPIPDAYPYNFGFGAEDPDGGQFSYYSDLTSEAFARQM